jgi:hypothetical protein
METNLIFTKNGNLKTYIIIEVEGHSELVYFTDFLKSQNIHVSYPDRLVYRFELKRNDALQKINQYIESAEFTNKVNRTILSLTQTIEMRKSYNLRKQDNKAKILDFEAKYPNFQRYLMLNGADILTTDLADGNITKLFDFIIGNKIDIKIETDYLYNVDDYSLLEEKYFYSNGGVDKLDDEVEIDEYKLININNDEDDDDDMCGCPRYSIEKIR